MPTWITGSLPGVDEPEVVAYTEAEQFSEGNWSASVVLRCPWGDRYELMANILSNELVYPYNPTANMTASAGSIAPMQNSRTEEVTGEMNGYGFADLTVQFTLKTSDAGSPGGGDPTAIFTEQIQPNGEMLKLPPTSPGNGDDIPGWVFRWGELPTDKQLTNEEAPTRLIIGLDYVVKWSKLTSVPAGILDLVDHVNDDDVVSSSLGLTFAAGTLLFNAPVISRSVTAVSASNKYDMECRWSVRPQGWNKFWDPRTGEFKEIWLHVEDETPVLYNNFPEADMTGVLP